MDAKHFCCAPNCPGYPWKASESRHPCGAATDGADPYPPPPWAKVEIAGQIVRAVVTWTPPRRIFAAVALDGSGVWAIGDSAEEARAGALDHRDYVRDCARSVDDDFPPPETDAAWLDTLALVTLSGTTEGLRALIRSMETGDPVAPWCPADLWDSGEVTP